MMFDRYQLREWARYAAAAWVLLMLISEILARAEYNARAEARSEVGLHKWNDHEQEEK